MSKTTASDLKEQGNRLFASRNYDDAIGCYTKAIVSTLHFELYFVLYSCIFL